MIKALGAAFKKMAQRNMMRGDRGAAEAIHNFGIAGMRSNFKGGRGNTTNTTNTQTTNKTEDVKIGFANESTKKHIVEDQTTNTTLGGSILDSVN